MKSYRDKAMVVLIGCAAALVLLELALRIFGSVLAPRRFISEPARMSPNAFVILCVGDSFTEGPDTFTGEKNYPQQLAEILRQTPSGQPVQVVNKGRGGWNTGMIADQLEEYLEQYKPDVVLILAGRNNFWNSYGYGRYLKAKGVLNQIADALYHVKIYKLVRLLMRDFENRRSQRQAALAADASSLPAWRSGRTLEIAGKYTEAAVQYKTVVRLRPDFYDAYCALGRVYFYLDKSAAFEWLRRAIEQNPDRPEAYAFLSSLSRNKQVFEAHKDFLQRHLRRYPAAADILMQGADEKRYQQRLAPWITHDIESFIRQAQEKKARVILQNYPDYGGGQSVEVKAVNEILRQLASKEHVWFIDHEEVFHHLMSREGRRQDYFSGDEFHCNGRGYAVMAEHVRAYMMQHVFITP